jgi:hypothetical protein
MYLNLNYFLPSTFSHLCDEDQLDQIIGSKENCLPLLSTWVHHRQRRTAYPYWAHEFTTVKGELLTLTEYMSSPPSKENCLPLLSTWVHHRQRRTAYPYRVHEFTTVKGALLTLTEYMSSPPSKENCLPLLSTWVHHHQRRTAYPYWVHEFTVFSGVYVAQSLVFCLVFWQPLIFLCPFSFGHFYCLPIFELWFLITPFGIFKLFLWIILRCFSAWRISHAQSLCKDLPVTWSW